VPGEVPAYLLYIFGAYDPMRKSFEGILVYAIEENPVAVSKYKGTIKQSPDHKRVYVWSAEADATNASHVPHDS
jgi:hypothetical protein